MAWDVCIKIPELPDPLELMLPGGISIKHVNLEGLVQPALAPLQPAFKILDAVTALVDCITALGKALAPPNPAKIAKAVDKLLPIPKSLASLAPPVAVPRMLAACLDLAMRSLGQVSAEIRHLQQQTVSLLDVEKVAQELGDMRLLAVFECTKHNVEQEVVNIGKGMASVGHLLGIISMFAKVAKLNMTIPDMSSLAGRPLDQAAAPIDDLIGVLRTLRQGIKL